MASVGDLVAHLDADTAKFNAAMRQSAAIAKALGYELDAVSAKGATAGGMGGSTKFAQSITQMGFALQDFSSVMQGGGGLGRAIGSVTNNVAMLGAAFGPWGMVVSSVGAALAGMIIPKMLEGSDSTATFAKAQKQAQEATERLVSAMERQAKMQADLNQLIEKGTEQQVKAAAKGNKNDLETLQKEIKIRGDEMRKQLQQALMQENLDAAGITGDAFKNVKGAVSRELGFGGDPMAGDNARKARERFGRMLNEQGPGGLFDKQGRLQGGLLKEFDDPKQTERFRAMRDQLLELQQREKELADQQKKLEGVQPEARQKDALKVAGEAFQQEMRLFEEGMQKRQKLWDDTRGPMERYRNRIEELKLLRMSGTIDDDLFMRGANKAAEGLSQRHTGAAALMQGSGAAISAINADRERQKQYEETRRMAQKALDEAKEQTRLLSAVEKALTDWVPVVISP